MSPESVTLPVNNQGQLFELKSRSKDKAGDSFALMSKNHKFA